ncbi:MAG: hypothetical protein ACR2N5_04265 [Solirubrobacterales bacterium]
MSGKTRRSGRKALIAIATSATLVAGGILVFGGNDSQAPAAAVDSVQALVATPAPVVAAPAPVEPTATCSAGELFVDPADTGVEMMPNCLPVSGPDRETHVEERYGAIATDLLERLGQLKNEIDVREAVVVCWSLADWKAILADFQAREFTLDSSLLGWVSRPERVINLSFHTCQRLDAITYDGRLPEEAKTAAVVSTLAHEAMHLGGIRDEGIADCYALQATVSVASDLGVDAAAARAIAELSAEYAHDQRHGTEYDHDDCFAGGALDLGIAGSDWH